MTSRLLILALAACGASTTLPSVRFANAPPVAAVNDRRDVPRVPATRVFMRILGNFDGQFFRPLTRALELPRPQRAHGVNALDEVPNSTWFTNRIGVRSLSPDEITAAPGGVGSPADHRPWTIVSSKVGGMSVGFIIKDGRGEKWLLKFDPRGYPEAETATQVIAGKLMWAFGFNVTEDYVLEIGPDDLVLAPDAMIKDVFGHKRPLDRAELAKLLRRVDVSKGGAMRVLVSHWLSGKPLGGPPAEGVRTDDPNDRIPHELRRDLRGSFSLFSWLDHIDIHEGNFLDLWTNDPADPKRHYVKHYLLDYGICLGFGARKNQEPRFGHENYVDFAEMARAFFSFGMASRAWEARRDTTKLGAGLFETDTYEPGEWKPMTAWYTPIYDADRFDKFWGAKIVVRFTREQIQAAVDAGKLSDPQVATWLVDTLVARQRATARYWFERVNPLDEFVVDDSRLCFKDLAITYAFTSAGDTAYTVETYDRRGRRQRSFALPADAGGVSCAPVALAGDASGYTIVRLTTRRPGFTGSTDVHLAIDPATHARRVIGIWRP